MWPRRSPRSRPTCPAALTGVRLPVDDEDADQPWKMHSVAAPCQGASIMEPMPKAIKIVLADQIYIDRTRVPSSLVAELVQRSPRFRIPSSIALRPCGCRRSASRASSLAPNSIPNHVGLPRGCLDEALDMLRGHRHRTDLVGRSAVRSDTRCVTSWARCTTCRSAAVAALEPHDHGVLAATTAFGKTVVAAKLIASRGCNTLVLVHRRQLGRTMASSV